jgi:hypothetical protein
MLQFQAGSIVASLNQPVTSGRITFTLLRPGPAVTLDACAPVAGRCSMTWSRRTAGSVTMVASWSGDRQYRPAAALLTIPIRRAPYTYTGTWHGTPVGPGGAAVHLSHATLVGQLRAYQTADPTYTCLNGQGINVYTAPRQFPGDYVVPTPGRGVRCPAGTWLFSQKPTVSPVRPQVGAPGTMVLVRGSFPTLPLANASVSFYSVGRVASVVPVVSWGSTTLGVLMPPHLGAVVSALQVGWYDRLTGAVVQSPLVPIQRLSNTAIPVIIPPTTKVLSPAVMRSLKRPPGGIIVGTQPRLTLTFTRVTPQLRALRRGDGLVAGITPATPYGLLRKVASVVIQGSRVSVLTLPATLRAAITQGVIHFHGYLQRSLSKCITAMQTPYSGPAGSAITYGGKVCLIFSFDFETVLISYRPVRSSFTARAEEQASALVSAGAAKQFKSEWPIPVPLNLPVMQIYVGVVPVLLVPKLQLTVGAAGSVSAGLSAGVLQSVSAAVRVSCLDADCTLTRSSSSPSLHADRGSVQCVANVKGYLNPQLDLLLYGVAGPDFGIEGYLQVQSDLAANPWWQLYGGIKATIGMTYALDVWIVHLRGSKSWVLRNMRSLLFHGLGPAYHEGAAHSVR